ncbi:MAG: hypothetical protein E6I76_07185 [Chloroflexi bacterium]|nr:MAG: hypothetical protein E6I76_07185 [Chloroflexota bacterium]
MKEYTFPSRGPSSGSTLGGGAHSITTRIVTVPAGSANAPSEAKSCACGGSSPVESSIGGLWPFTTLRL